MINQENTEQQYNMVAWSIEYRIPEKSNRLIHTVEAVDRGAAIARARFEIIKEYNIKSNSITILSVNQTI